MTLRPQSFGQLLRRLESPSVGSQSAGPFIASAAEVTAIPAENASPSWVILHSITDSDVRLIHARPLAGGKFMVKIPVESGEVLSVTLAMADSRKNGDLYESTAQFI